MKKLYLKLFLMLVFIISPIKEVYAGSGSLSLSCPDKISTGKELTCTISGVANDTSISSLEGKIVTSGNIEFVNFKTDSIWQGTGDNGSVDLYTESNKTSSFAIGTVTLKVKDEASNEGGVITLNNFTFYDASFSPFSVSNVSKNIKIASNDNYLSSLSISCGNLNPSFNKDTLSYTTSCEGDNVNILATVSDSKSSLTGTGVKKLTYGNNYFYVTVTSESGNKRDYKIVITKPDDRNSTNNNTPDKDDDNISNDTGLKSLLISGYNIEFHSNVYEYTVNVGYDVEKLDISYIPNNKDAKVNIVGNDKFNFGNNEVKITVVAEDGSSSNYVLNVIKKSKECIVNNINISGYEIDFDCNNYNYELKIKDEDSLNIVVFLNNNSAKANVYNNFNLKNNEVIRINVDLAGEKYEYNIKILKDEKTNFLLIGGIALGIIIIGILVTIFIIKKRNKMKKNVVTDELVWVPNDNNYN